MRSLRFAFVDVETTGLEAAAHEVLEVGVVVVEHAKVSHRVRWLVAPTRPVPRFIEALTGLNAEQRQAALPWAEVKAKTKDLLAGCVVVAHNASFERSYLGDVLPSAVLDSCEVLHLLFPERPSHSLDALARWLDVEPRPRHRALEDAETTFDVVRAALSRAKPAFVEELRRRLQVPSPSASRQALVELLGDEAWRVPVVDGHPSTGSGRTDLVRKNTEVVDGHPSTSSGRTEWVDHLNRARSACIDIDLHDVTELIAAARDVGGPVLLALPSPKSARRFASKHQLPLLPALVQVQLPDVVEDEERSLAHAVLWSRAQRLPLEAPHISRFLAEAHPSFVAECEACSAPRAPTPIEGLMVTTHERAALEHVLTAFIDAPFTTPLDVKCGLRCHRALKEGTAVVRFETTEAVLAALPTAPQPFIVTGTDLEPAFQAFPSAVLVDARRLQVGEGAAKLTVLLDAIDEEEERWSHCLLGPNETLWCVRAAAD